jgi:hypothetical protein
LADALDAEAWATHPAGEGSTERVNDCVEFPWKSGEPSEKNLEIRRPP